VNEPLPGTPGPVRTWLLVYSRARRRQPWLRIVNVPRDATRHDVLAALETWRQWPQYAPGPSGRCSLVTAERPGALDGDVARTSEVDWATLAPEHVKTTIELPGDVHARVVMAARQRGQTQREFITETIAAAVAS